MALTPKQQRFCEEYLIDLNATQAAIRAGIDWSRRDGFYVYFLSDPDSGEIFYVGKGKGNRCYSHINKARNNHIDNAPKYKKIKAILNNNSTPTVYIFNDNLTEEDAFTLERNCINQFKNHGLTNIQGGVVSNGELVKEQATSLLRRVIPFSYWYASVKNDPCKFLPAKRDIESMMESYFCVVNSLKSLSAQGKSA